MTETLEERIKRHEGLRLKPYKDTRGHETIGYGHKMTAKEKVDLADGITLEKAEALFKADLLVAKNMASIAVGRYYGALHPIARDVVIEMTFQMGMRGVLGFRKMLRALDVQDYATAADEMLDSDWNKQTPKRCQALADIMRGLSNVS